MACFLLNKNNVNITIPKVLEEEKVSYYIISIEVGSVAWTVQHRYSDFVTLHDKLVTDHCVNKEILPPKKMIGKRDPVFVEKRRIGLETYLASVVSFLKETMPRVLALFLDFHKYDILFLLQEMSSSFLSEGDCVLGSESYKFTTLQLHAISERLKQPCPPAEMFDRRHDFSHVLDACARLGAADAAGSWEAVGASNLVPNSVCDFELSAFKNLTQLTLNKVCLARVYGLGSLRRTLARLSATECDLASPADLLLCDVMHREALLDSESGVPEDKVWTALEDVDFGQNRIRELGRSVCLIPNVQRLSASENEMSVVDDLSSLASLTHFSMSANRLRDCALGDLRARLPPGLAHLDLSQNHITMLAGLSALGSLQGLDLGSNIISDVDEVEHVKDLPRLDHLVLTGNPVATIVDYRIKVLERFGRRAGGVSLDRERPTQQELERAAVLRALRMVRAGAAPEFSRTVEPTFPTAPQ